VWQCGSGNRQCGNAAMRLRDDRAKSEGNAFTAALEAMQLLFGGS